MTSRVCAIIVTYNRKDLLREALYAVMTQAHMPDQIFVIDNASTDDTAAMLADEFKNATGIVVITLPENSGGAGGFYAGMKRAHAEGFDWLWLLDDDSIADSGALGALLLAYESYSDKGRRPLLLASKVIWTDGDLHPMNIPRPNMRNMDDVFDAAERSHFPIRIASFVSLLIHRSVIDQYKFPIRDYFIWNDDTEFTARVLKQEFGVAVPASVVIHKTLRKYVPLDDVGPRYYYGIRNRIWMITRSQAWTGLERIRLTLSVLRSTVLYLYKNHFSWISLKVIIRGYYHGLFRSPGSHDR